jgi:hypothetical protein
MGPIGQRKETRDHDNTDQRVTNYRHLSEERMKDTASAGWRHHGRYDWDHDMFDLNHGDPAAEVVRPGIATERVQGGVL